MQIPKIEYPVEIIIEELNSIKLLSKLLHNVM